MKSHRGILYLFTGLALGLGVGLVIAWALVPSQFVDTSPASLRIDFKDEYRSMIALAYQANDDLARAQARLNTLEDEDHLKALGEQAQRMLARQSPMETVQVLADLSEALRTIPTLASPISQAANSATPNTQELIGETSTTPPDDVLIKATEAGPTQTNSPEPSPTETESSTPIPAPIATLAPQPKPSATSTPGPAFELIQQTSLCEPSQPGLLQIYLLDGKGKPVAGMELVITWFGGEEHFFSGLKSEISPGYADYTLSENVEYDLSLSAAGSRVTGLRANSCTDASGNSYPGSIRLEFKQP